MGVGVWFLLPIAVLVLGPYTLGVPPRSARDWRAITITAIFVGMMLSVTSLRSR